LHPRAIGPIWHESQLTEALGFQLLNHEPSPAITIPVDPLAYHGMAYPTALRPALIGVGIPHRDTTMAESFSIASTTSEALTADVVIRKPSETQAGFPVLMSTQEATDRRLSCGRRYPRYPAEFFPGFLI